METLLWSSFALFIMCMLVLDLFVFHRKSHVVEYKEALIWSVIWIALALTFCFALYLFKDSVSALNFLTGYLIEKALSIDNLFVFLVIFSYFAVPEQYQHKILMWGLIGALIMRAIFIFAGIALIQKFHWVIYLFGILLIFTGIQLALEKKQVEPEKNFMLRLFKKIFPMTSNYENGHFFIKRQGRYWATPLFAVLLVIETSDILFAIDSVPAILAITTDPFIVYTSNVFAILGLRALYFALSKFMQTFAYLHYGLAAILVLIGVKMLISEYVNIPIYVSLTMIALILLVSVIASFFTHRPEHPSRK